MQNSEGPYSGWINHIIFPTQGTQAFIATWQHHLWGANFTWNEAINYLRAKRQKPVRHDHVIMTAIHVCFSIFWLMKHIPYPMRAQQLWWIILLFNMLREWVSKSERSGRIAWTESWSLFWVQIRGSHLSCMVIRWPVFILPQRAFYILADELRIFNSFRLSIRLYWQQTSFFLLSLALNSWSSCLCLPPAKITYMHHHPWLNLCIV